MKVSSNETPSLQSRVKERQIQERAIVGRSNALRSRYSRLVSGMEPRARIWKFALSGDHVIDYAIQVF